MARKKRRSRNWILTVLFYLLFPFAVWFVAFVVWFYWFDLERLFFGPKEISKKPPVQSKTEREDQAKPEAPAADRSREEIVDEDRRKLDAILKRLQERRARDEGP